MEEVNSSEIGGEDLDLENGQILKETEEKVGGNSNNTEMKLIGGKETVDNLKHSEILKTENTLKDGGTKETRRQIEDRKRREEWKERFEKFKLRQKDRKIERGETTTNPNIKELKTRSNLKTKREN